MATRYSEIRAFVRHLTPTWRKTQHENFARVIAAFLERPSLNVSESARAMPRPDQPLHGRIKRLGRFLDNPPILMDTVYFDPSAMLLVATVPCGSRGLPIALATYHRRRTPMWRPRQIRYRLEHWWADSTGQSDSAPPPSPPSKVPSKIPNSTSPPPRRSAPIGPQQKEGLRKRPCALAE